MTEIDEIIAAFDEVQQPRSEFELRHFVVQNKDTEAMAYSQTVLELSIGYDNLRLAKIHVQIVEAEIEALLEAGDKISLLNVEKKAIELEQTRRAVLGAMREFEALVNIWREFDHKYTRAEIEADQREYWSRRITRQANQDFVSSGRLSVGNIDALGMIGKSAVPREFIAALAAEHGLKLIEGNDENIV